MRYFPLFLDFSGRSAIVAGGGEAAAQKVRLLLRTEATVTVFAPRLTPELADLAASARIRWQERHATPEDVALADVLFVAGEDGARAQALADAARAANVPANVVDRPELCSALMPALIDRDPLVVAVGTEGAAPVLAQGLKSRIEAMLPPALGALATRGRALRDRVASTLPEGAPRRRFWRSFFFGRTRDSFLTRDHDAFERTLERDLDDAGQEARFGRVALVGAGPGDPELLTLKAQRLLQEADIIVHDRLVSPGILDYARRDAERVLVGKRPGGPSHRQSEINRLLVREALAGKLVVRLKGGDPYIFGRGGEEQAALEANGIPVEVVPGITAALGCAASLRQPLTQRGSHRALTLLTGASEDGTAEHDWGALVRSGATLAVYMGVRAAGHVGRSLLAAGADAATPVTVVENGTLEEELSVDTNLAALASGLRDYGIEGPALLLIGAPEAATRPEAPRDGSRLSEPFPTDSDAAQAAWLKVLP